MAGAEVHLAARVGADFPPAVLRRLRERGIRLDRVERVRGPSRRASLIDRCGAERSPQRATSAWWERTRALAPPLADIAVDACVLTPMPPELARAYARGYRGKPAWVVADTSEAYAAAAPDDVLALAAEVDVFAPSRAEVALLVPAGNAAACHQGVAKHARVLVEKGGEQGFWLTTPEVLRRPVPSVATDVKDTTGAGDASVGAIAAGLARGLDVAAAVGRAAEIAARAVGGIGPTGLGLDLALTAED
jgi:sugar/nucleoside kinase (ribokinase family)